MESQGEKCNMGTQTGGNSRKQIAVVLFFNSSSLCSITIGTVKAKLKKLMVALKGSDNGT